MDHPQTREVTINSFQCHLPDKELKADIEEDLVVSQKTHRDGHGLSGEVLASTQVAVRCGVLVP